GQAPPRSHLRVIYELGRRGPVAAHRALALSDTACSAHNLRACANRESLLLKDGTAHEPAREGVRIARSERGSGG
ncbi:MAG: hypothetical protein ACLQBL_22020, partial [Polyangiaceae bacterium]